MNKGTSGRSTLVVMLGTSLSRVLGFLRLAVVNAVFGGGAIADVLNSTFNIPNNLRKLLAEGALSTAFVPIMTRHVKDKESRADAQSLVGTVWSFQLWILIPLVILCFIFSEAITQVIFPFSHALQEVTFSDGSVVPVDQSAMAADLFPWMMQYLVFVSLSAVLMAVLNVHGAFTLTSLAPLMFSLSVITILLALNRQMFVWAQVLGVLIGGLGQFLILAWGYRRLGYRWSFRFQFWKHPDFRPLMALMVPVLGSSVIFTLTEILATTLAAAMPTGSATALQNAIVFWQLPYGVFSASISTVFYPRLARLSAENDLIGTKKTLGYGIRSMVYLLIPSSVALLSMGNGLVVAAFHRGNFTMADAELAALVLAGYAFGMLPMGLVSFMQRFFFSRQSRKIPFMATVRIAILDVVLSIISLFLGIGPLGLALAHTISSLWGAWWMYRQASALLPVQDPIRLGASLLKALAASIPVVIFAAGAWLLWGPWWRSANQAQVWLVVMSLVFLGVVSVLSIYRIIGVKEVFQILGRSGRETSDNP